MNAFGDFLYELRKEQGMTQAELADKLGVTNKAVSKWETGEAMPETGLLLPLAEIFGVTVDELLNGRRSDGKKTERNGGGGEASDDEKEQNGDAFKSIADTIGENLFTRGKDDKTETFSEKLCGVICTAVFFIGLAVYLFFGALADLWHPYWVIVPCCALLCGVIGIVFSWGDREKCKQKRADGKNPYTEGVCGIVILFCIIAYLLFGALADLWHPYWIIVFVGVVVGSLIAAIGNCFGSRKK